MTEARHVSEVDGTPLLPATEIAVMFGVQPKTVHAWEARGKIACEGLDEHGVRLFPASQAAQAEASSRSRARRAHLVRARLLASDANGGPGAG